MHLNFVYGSFSEKVQILKAKLRKYFQVQQDLFSVENYWQAPELLSFRKCHLNAEYFWQNLTFDEA